MAVVTLQQLKNELRITTPDHDELLAQMISVCEDEARRFLNLDALPNEPSVYAGVVLFARAKYDAITPEEIMRYRAAGESLLMPLRQHMGV